jgi:lauroyl/myristoyl acyltransferase
VVRALQLAQLLAAAAPEPLARGLAENIGVTFSRRPGSRPWQQRREMIARHLSRVLGPGSPPIGDRRMGRLVDDAVASYARYWAESLRIPGLGAAQLTAGITYEGFQHITSSRAAGRGTILAVPHLGGWEWAGTQLAAVGHPVSVVVERLQPPELFAWFTEYRERLGMHVIPSGPGAAAACVAALKDNHLLCLLSDRLIEGTSGVDVEFFGERTQLPAGPATLALRSGAALLPCAVFFGKRTGEHLGVILPPLDTARRGRLRDDVVRVTQELAACFEGLVRRAPTQWHLLQPNWPSDVAGGGGAAAAGGGAAAAGDASAGGAPGGAAAGGGPRTGGGPDRLE